jgi:hypothetical protein
MPGKASTSKMGHSRRFCRLRDMAGTGHLGSSGCPILPVEGVGMDVIEAGKREPGDSKELGRTFRRNEIAKT